MALLGVLLSLLASRRAEPVRAEDEAAAPRGATATELVREAVDEARELARLEVELAKNEARGELKALKACGIAFSVALASALLGVALLLVALALVLGGAAVALLLGVGLISIATVAAWVGSWRLPKKPLGETRRRLEDDIERLKERTG
jgi:hypothetical protein